MSKVEGTLVQVAMAAGKRRDALYLAQACAEGQEDPQVAAKALGDAELDLRRSARAVERAADQLAAERARVLGIRVAA